MAPWVGDWIGTGWSWETRFRQSQKDFVNGLEGGHADALGERENIQGNVMELMVQHETTFGFTVDTDGNITGQGEITYDLAPNLCGLAALTAQVNQAVSRMAWITKIFKIANDIGTGYVQTLNQEYYKSENELKEAIEDLQPSGLAPGAVTEDQISHFENEFIDMENSKDGRELALSEILFRCAGANSRDYEFVTGLPCDIVTQPAVEAEIKSDVKELGRAASDAIQEKWEEDTKEEAKKTMDELKGVEKEEDDACAAVGPTNLDEYEDHLYDGFKEIYAGYEKDIGTAAATASIANMSEEMLEKAEKAALEAADPQKMVAMMLNIPGITQVAYEYKGLENGPEHRTYKIKGHVTPSGKTMADVYLNMDGDVSDGDKDLTVEYMVNYKWDTGKFPTFSPFLGGAGTGHLSGTATIPGESLGQGSEEGDEGLPLKEQMKTPFATFYEHGSHRNRVEPWQEYEYFWYAHQVTRLIPAGSATPSNK